MWRCSSGGQSMRLISAVSGVQIPAPPPFLHESVSTIFISKVKEGSMTRILSLLTLVSVFGNCRKCPGSARGAATRKTPLDAQPSVSQTKAAAKPVQSAKATEKAKTNAKPAPVQAATYQSPQSPRRLQPKTSLRKPRRMLKQWRPTLGEEIGQRAEKPKKPKIRKDL